MLVNLTDIFTSENKTETYEIPYEHESISIQNMQIQIAKKTPLSLIVKNNGIGKAVLQGNMSLELILLCDRCLKEVNKSFDLSFSYEVVSPEYTTGNETEELDFIQGYHLNTDDLIYSEMLLNWPMKILCRKDCKGICRICGKDLNTGACGCDTFVPSPGLAGIKEIFNANKEV